MSSQTTFTLRGLDLDKGLFLIAGPCVIESEAHALKMAEAISAVAGKLRIPYIFKASYDKANRTSVQSFRGPGLEEGLRILEKIKKEAAVPVLTDVHEAADVAAVAGAVDVLQIPAFLCRQTDLLVAAGKHAKAINIKKGQFVSPWDMQHAVEKVRQAGSNNIFLTERGSSFGYNNLVVDMRGLADMRALGVPVVFDATHSVQLPGGAGDRSGGERVYVPALARAAVAFGVDALFMEMHEDPDRTMPDGQPLSDGPNMLRIDDLPVLLDELRGIEQAIRRR
jgi:2-dehydro-3-deoxyphosphooctonate aldolase (KDO 8-P synthase)